MKVQGELDVEEVKSDKKLVIRDSEHLDPGYKLKKNFEFPAADQLRYDVTVNGFTHDGSNWGMNIILSNGSKSSLPMPSGWTDERLPDDVFPQKVICFYNYVNGHSHLNGVQYLDHNDKVLLEGGNSFGQQRVVLLEEGERIIGVKSHTYDFSNPQHSDFQLVIGRLV